MSTPLATVTDLQAYYPGVTFSGSTRPTSDQIEAWINNASEIIYGALSSRYSLPITNLSDRSQLQDLCESYILGKIDFVLGKSRTMVSQNGVMVPRTISHKQFMATVDQYSTGTLVLYNTANNSTTVGAYSYNATNEIEPTAEKGTVQW